LSSLPLSLILFLVFILFVLLFLLGFLGHFLLFYVRWPSQHHGWIFLLFLVFVKKNLVCWLMYDIDLHPLRGADKFREDFIVVTTRQVVEGYWPCVIVTIGQTVFSVFSVCFALSFQVWAFSFSLFAVMCWGLKSL
jgi:hypothetical protein